MINIVKFLSGGVFLLGLLLFTLLRTNIVMADPCLADINQDGSVNGGDMMILAEEMGREDCYVSPCQTDFNGDGKIDGEDKAMLQSEFGRYDCLSSKEDKFRKNINVLQREQDEQFDEGDNAAIVMADPCLTDINQDGSVNGGDMMILSEEMGREDCYVLPCQADFNGDGKIDGEDKAILQSEFGRYDCLSSKEDKFRENINVSQREQGVQFDENDNVAEDKTITSDEVDEKKSSKEGTAVVNSRFKDNGNGTVLDLKTGLMWTRDANLPGDTMLFHQALDYIAGMNEGEYSNFGYTDWRLPALNELRSLIDYTKLTNKVHVLPIQHPFKNVQSLSLYRQSVTYLSNSDHPGFVSLYCRLVGHNVTFCHGYVWPVRGGEQL